MVGYGYSFLGKTAISGVGYTKFSKNSNKSVLSLATEACTKAIEDSGISIDEVDGIANFSMLGDSVPSQAVATSLAVKKMNFVMDFHQGGQSPCYMVMLAAMAVEAGLAKNILVYRALNGRSGIRVGSTPVSGPAGQYRYPVGYTAYPQYVGMWARRYMIETGATYEDLAAVPIAQRKYAELNERAIIRKPLTLNDYLQSPMIADPFRLVDCTSEIDGACAVLVTSLDRARTLRHTPVVIRGAAYVAGTRSGLDIGDTLLWDDYTRNFSYFLADDLWKSAKMGPEDMDFAEIYDCFSSTVLVTLEGLGFVKTGEAGPFIRSGETALNGKLPVNTHGGLLSEGYLHGMNTVTEAVLQLQGRSGKRQVPKSNACVVTSGAMADGSALVLTRD